MILFIAGPTASGKTELAEELAVKNGAEIISADSRQVYRRLSVGTSKPSGSAVPYHLIDFLEPDKVFSAGEFVSKATAAVKDIAARRRNVIIAGGTGLYIRSLIEGITELPEKNEKIRKQLTDDIKKHGAGMLYQKLSAVDAASARSIHPNNVQRVIRALEVYEITGTPLSELHKKGKVREGLSASGANFVIIGLRALRQTLYGRINRRAEKMLKNGMIEETKELLKDYPETSPALNSVGYDHVIAFLKNKTDKNTLSEKVAQDTRNYAKRQITWFNAEKNIVWLDAENKNTGELAAEVLKLWKE